MEIVIVDSHKVICDSVRMIAGSVAGCSVLGQAGSMEEVLTLLKAASGPLTVVCGARLRDGCAPDLMAACEKAGTAASVIVLTSPTELGYAREALKAGACAVCLVDDIHDKLPRMLRAQADGVVSVPARLMQRLLSDEGDRLTRREHEIMLLLSKGLTNFQISARLGLSQNTVKYYLKTIYQKMDVTSRGAAIAKFVAGEF